MLWRAWVRDSLSELDMSPAVAVMVIFLGARRVLLMEDHSAPPHESCLM